MEKIWLKHYPAGVPAQVRTDRYPSLLALLDEGFRRHAALPAYKYMGRSYRFADIDAHARALAAYLQGLGLERGDRVTVVDNLSTGRRANLPDAHTRLRFIEADLGEGVVGHHQAVAATHLEPRKAGQVQRAGEARREGLGGHRRRPAGPRIIHEPVQAMLQESRSPFADRGAADPEPLGHHRVRGARRALQNDPRAQRQSLRRLPPPSPADQLHTLLVTQDQISFRTPNSCHTPF